VTETVINGVDKLKQCLVDVWHSLQQSVIDAAINKYREQLTVCIRAELQMNVLNTCSELVKRLKKLLAMLTLCILQKRSFIANFAIFTVLEVCQIKVRILSR